MDKETAVERLIAEGFVKVTPDTSGMLGVSNHSGSAAEIFLHPELNQVAKIGWDPCYSIFVEWAQQNSHYRVPAFVDHFEYVPNGPLSGFGYTCTKMERLEELTSAEGALYLDWHLRIMARKALGVPIREMIDDDPFGILPTFAELNDLANTKTNAGTPTRLDLGKAENVMVRSSPSVREIVFTDPFN
jgi:hypothetical protein